MMKRAIRLTMRPVVLIALCHATCVGEPLFADSVLSTLDPVVEGDRQVWHPLSVSFRGPVAEETDDQPNPFLDYRMQVLFTSPSGRTYDVPGFFDGDGHGGSRGNVWRVRIAPDEPGRWSYQASFRSGDGVAVSLDSRSGRPAAFDEVSGQFEVRSQSADGTGRPGAEISDAGFLKWGRLEYVGGHYLKFRDGPYWIRGGTNSPENLLAYAGFDNTVPSHTYSAHIGDWQPGDPDWGNMQGRGIIGALNYLASRHVNSVYFMPMNVGGDGNDVWPWVRVEHPTGSPDNDNLHFDVSKLRQWETVFDHAQRKGIFLHFVLNEAERPNKQELDDGELGTERKLYYRELISRFSHHLALEWNLCEEYNLQFDLGPDRLRAFADYIRQVDPYGHPIAVHSAGDPVEKLAFTFGDERFSLTSIQLNQRPIEQVTESIRTRTARAGRPLPVSLDEFTVFGGQSLSHLPVDDAEKHRRQKLWPTYFSGGMIDFIQEGFLSVDSFKTEQRENLWRYLWIARKFMQDHLPFWEMEPADELIRGAASIPVRRLPDQSHRLGAQVFAKLGTVYAIYFPTATSTGQIDLSAAKNDLTLRWFNPRTGSFEGDERDVSPSDDVPIGSPPADADQDWVVLIK